MISVTMMMVMMTKLTLMEMMYDGVCHDDNGIDDDDDDDDDEDDDEEEEEEEDYGSLN